MSDGLFGFLAYAGFLILLVLNAYLIYWISLQYDTIRTLRGQIADFNRSESIRKDVEERLANGKMADDANHLRLLAERLDDIVIEYTKQKLES